MDEGTKNKSGELGEDLSDAEKVVKHEEATGDKTLPKKNSSPAESDYNMMRESIDHARHLLKYAAEAGKTINEETQQLIVDFSQKVHSGDKWDSKEESKFLSEVCKVSQELKPVTYETLKSSRGRSAKFYVCFFGLLTSVILILLVYAQFVWVVLGNVTNTIEVRMKELNIATIDLKNLEQQNEAFMIKLQKLESERNANPKEKDQIKNQISSLEDNIQTNNNNINKITNSRNEIESQLEASARILIGYLPFKSWLMTTRPPDPGWFDSEKEKIIKIQAITNWEKKQQTEYSFRNKALHSWAKQILQGGSSYILPMIYGLLGACAFVLRLISKQVRELSFSKSTALVQYMLRIILGALAGISIGWFLKPDPSGTNTLATISPLALAFVAGYSVELVFTAMDKIITAFTGKNPDQAKAETKGPN